MKRLVPAVEITRAALRIGPLYRVKRGWQMRHRNARRVFATTTIEKLAIAGEAVIRGNVAMLKSQVSGSP